MCAHYAAFHQYSKGGIKPCDMLIKSCDDFFLRYTMRLPWLNLLMLNFITPPSQGQEGSKVENTWKRTNRNYTVNSSGLSSMHENNISKQRNRNLAKIFPRKNNEGLMRPALKPPQRNGTSEVHKCRASSWDIEPIQPEGSVSPLSIWETISQTESLLPHLETYLRGDALWEQLKGWFCH